MTSPKAGWILLGGGVVRGEGAPVVGVEPPVRKLLLGDLAIPAPPTPPPARPHARTPHRWISRLVRRAPGGQAAALVPAIAPAPARRVSAGIALGSAHAGIE